MHCRHILTTILILTASIVIAQPKTDTLLARILSNSESEIVQSVLHQKDTFRLQIIYTQIVRNRRNVPHLTNYHFNTDTDLYFNPASTVKMPLAFLALEKLNEMGIKGVNKYIAIQFDSSYQNQVASYSDSTSDTGLPSIAHYIKKAFLVSDNDAYNRLYQFVGQQTINRALKSKGYPNTRITRQFMGFSERENRHTNQIRFVHEDGSLLYLQPPAFNPDSFHFNKVIRVGKAHYNRHDSLINEPIDFTKVNNVPLEDLQHMLQSVVFPESVPASQRFRLSKEDYRFLYRVLSQYPSETSYPKYDTTEYYDSYVKFFFRGDRQKMSPGVRIFNKVGWAYGFLTDVSYIVDFDHGLEFMLTATLYVNSDQILNDDRYEYESIGWPFLYDLGQTIYHYELQRERQCKPKLKAFKVKYEKRDPGDRRPSIKEVDN